MSKPRTSARHFKRNYNAFGESSITYNNLCSNPHAATTDYLDQAADLFDKAMHNATARVGKPRRPSPKAKPELTDAANRLKDLRRQLKDEEQRVRVRSRHI